LGHTLSHHGIAKGGKVDAVLSMPRPHDVSSLKSLLGSVQFYSKFLPNLSTITDPLYLLTRKDNEWSWGEQQEVAFTTLKEMLSMDMVLAHFDPSLSIGISCDTSSAGICTVLFHRFPDGSERPIANISYTLSTTQRSTARSKRKQYP